MIMSVTLVVDLEYKDESPPPLSRRRLNTIDV